MCALASDFCCIFAAAKITELVEIGGFSSSGRASGSQSEGGRFESGNLHKTKRKPHRDVASLFLSAYLVHDQDLLFVQTFFKPSFYAAFGFFVHRFLCGDDDNDLFGSVAFFRVH